MVESEIAAGIEGHKERALRLCFSQVVMCTGSVDKCSLVRPKDTSTSYVAGIGVGG